MNLIPIFLQCISVKIILTFYPLVGFSYFAQANDLKTDFYQKLLNRGWRRSGMALYKPDLRASCCTQYTTRLNSHMFSPSREQRQRLNRFNRYIIGEAYIEAAASLYPKTHEQSRRRKQNFDLVERIHESEQAEQTPPLEHAHSFVVTLEANNFTEEKFYIYQNYQQSVHQDSPAAITRDGFRRFLCESPLRNGHISENNCSRLLGSYHQCYRIDGNLVAVGVLDLLPECVSAVYFMYHESVRDFCFGKLSAMREIALAKEKGYIWWYPGYYIHNCIKMRYKGDYYPQYILSPESYTWHLFTEDIKQQLSLRKYISLSSSNGIERTMSNGTSSALPHNLEESDMYMPIGDDEIEIPLFARDMPGILSKDKLLSEVDLDSIYIRIGDVCFFSRDLENWRNSSIESGYSIKGIIAEIVAAVGPELSREMILDFR